MSPGSGGTPPGPVCSRASRDGGGAEIVKLRRAALIAPAVVIAMTAAACGGDDNDGGGGGGTEGVTGGQLVYGFETAFPENWFPSIAAGNSVATAYAEIRVLLAPFRTYPDFTIKPDTDLVVGEPTTQTTGSKQVVTYKVNPAAVWSDGDPIDAKDFKFTWRAAEERRPDGRRLRRPDQHDRLRPDRVGRGRGQRQDRHGDLREAVLGLEVAVHACSRSTSWTRATRRPTAPWSRRAGRPPRACRSPAVRSCSTRPASTSTRRRPC